MFICASFIMPVIACANGQDFEEDHKILSLPIQDEKFASNQEEGKKAGAFAFMVDEEKKLFAIFNSEEEEKAIANSINEDEDLRSDGKPKLFYSYNESEKDEAQSILASVEDQEDKTVNLFNEEEKSISLI